MTPSNFLEIDVSNPQTVGVGRGRFTTYEIRVKVRPSFRSAGGPLTPAQVAPSGSGADPLGWPLPPRPGPQGDAVVALRVGWGRKPGPRLYRL